MTLSLIFCPLGGDPAPDGSEWIKGFRMYAANAPYYVYVCVEGLSDALTHTG